MRIINLSTDYSPRITSGRAQFAFTIYTPALRGNCKRKVFFLITLQPTDRPTNHSLYGARLQEVMVVVFIKPFARLSNDEYNYTDSLQACAIEGIGHWTPT